MTVDLSALSPKLVNLLLDTVFAVDEQGIIVFVSQACQQLLGYTPSEMIGTPVLGYLHPDDLDRTRAAANRVMAGQSHIDFENRYLHRSGRVVHILWSARWSPEDRLRIAVARDVTALRRADQTRNALYRISEAAHEAPTIRALCNDLKALIEGLFPESRLYLVLRDADKGTLTAPDWSTVGGVAWHPPEANGDSALARVLESGQALLATANPTQSGAGAVRINGNSTGNWLGMPLIAREDASSGAGDKVLGALVIETLAEGHHYEPRDQELLQFVATQVATAVVRKRVEERLRFLAHHDGLTGLTNRALFYDRLETAVRQASRTESRHALLFLDLNGFKQINDTWGHEAGDRILIEVARRLEDSTRETDTVARMGGDEFTVLLTHVQDRAAVEMAASKIRELLALPVDVGGHSLQVSSSIGVAVYPEDGTTARELVARADTHMYSVKRPAPKGRAVPFGGEQ